MTRQEKIDEFQDQAQHYRISKEELGKECEDNDIDLHDEERWELVRYNKEAEEWECMGVYYDNALFAHELKDLLNKTKEEK